MKGNFDRCLALLFGDEGGYRLCEARLAST